MPVTLDAIADPAVLARAFDAVLARHGMAGADRVTVDDFAGNLANELSTLRDELASGAYRSRPVLRVPVVDGAKIRPLAVPAVRDRVVQRAIADVLVPVVEPMLSGAAHAFRPGRGVRTAVRRLTQELRPDVWVLVADIHRFFERIDQSRLLENLASVVQDRRVIDVVRDMLRAQILDQMTLTESLVGVHQGSPLSPVLSNLYLASFDRGMMSRCALMIRYCDDIVMLCSDEVAADAVRARAETELDALGLSLHPTKTRVVPPGSPFVFLGYRFEDGCPGPTVEAVEALKTRILQVARDAKPALQTLDAVVRGWCEYFGPAPSDAAEGPAGYLARSRLPDTFTGPMSPAPPADPAAACHPWCHREVARVLESVGDWMLADDHRRLADSLEARDTELPCWRAPRFSGALDDGGFDPDSYSLEDRRRLMELFGGNETRHAVEFVDSKGRRFVDVDRPVTDDDIVAHLRGRTTLGIPLFRDNGTVRVAVVDVDVRGERLKARDGDPASDLDAAHDHARGICAAAQRLGLAVILEDSGWKGRHVWIPFAEAVPGAVAWRLLKRLVGEAGPAPEGIRCELFPDRDRVRSGRIGPVMKLPLGRHGRTGRRCMILDPASGGEILDPRLLLEAFEPVPRDRILRVAGIESTRDVCHARQVADPPWADADGEPLHGFSGVLNVLRGCAVLRHLWRKVRATAYLTHQDRLVFLQVVGHLGADAGPAVHRIMSFTFNYDEAVTEHWIRRRQPRPVSCPRIRKQYPEISSRLNCDCRFRLAKDEYPTPLLHAMRTTRVSRPESPGPVATRGADPTSHVAERIPAGGLADLLELLRQRRELDRVLEARLKEWAAGHESVDVGGSHASAPPDQEPVGASPGNDGRIGGTTGSGGNDPGIPAGSLQPG